MLSIIVLIRNTRSLADNCLQSLLEAERAMGLGKGSLEYILIDDFSDPESGIAELMLKLRDLSAADVRIVRFKKHQHYAYGLACGLSLARGSQILFFSHDMVVPPACIQMLLQAAATDSAIGILRPISGHLDHFNEAQLSPPFPPRSIRDVALFAQLVAGHRGPVTLDTSHFIGDAMLIKREVLDRIGVFDTRYFGFMADIDFGIRARRAGFRITIAPGAWLLHVGAGFRHDVVKTSGKEAEALVGESNVRDTEAAYAQFRAKWGTWLPQNFRALAPAIFDQAHALPPGPYDALQPPLHWDPAVCENL